MTDSPQAQSALATPPSRTGPGLDSLMIERATPAHVPYLRRLKVGVMADRYRPADTDEDFERWKEVYCTDDYFQGLLEDPDAKVLCLGSLREPVGMIVLRRRGDQLEIDDLLCLHDRQGDGTRLLVAALRYAEAWRKAEVYIDVYPGHAHVEPFLASHGFEYVGPASNDLGREMHRYARIVEHTVALD